MPEQRTASVLETSCKMSPFENPFDATESTDRHALWQSLIARDSDAFAELDWSICAADFAADRFEGISAHGSLDPLAWHLSYPTVDSYRDDWTRMAREFLAVPLAEISHRELLYRMQSFARVELIGDRALVWKQFTANEALTSGGRYKVSAQSVYRLHRIDRRWMIVGFVGYLPLEHRNEMG
jgi:hypothetical protein